MAFIKEWLVESLPYFSEKQKILQCLYSWGGGEESALWLGKVL